MQISVVLIFENISQHGLRSSHKCNESHVQYHSTYPWFGMLVNIIIATYFPQTFVFLYILNKHFCSSNTFVPIAKSNLKKYLITSIAQTWYVLLKTKRFHQKRLKILDAAKRINREMFGRLFANVTNTNRSTFLQTNIVNTLRWLIFLFFYSFLQHEIKNALYFLMFLTFA